MKHRVIDFGALEKLVKEAEKLLDKHDLNVAEQQLLITTLQKRLTAKRQQARASDLMGNMPLGGLMKKAMKLAGGKESDD